MRRLSIVLLVFAACGHDPISTLPLRWRGVGETPRPSESVAQSFAAAPLGFVLRDLRPDPSAVGADEETGIIVRTYDNVGQYCSTQMGEMLARAGARMSSAPMAMLETELLEFRVVEGGTFNGMVRIRAIVRHGGDAWAKVYIGKSRRWGRSHSPDNMNEALSNALADVTEQLVQDDAFAHAIVPAVALRAPSPGG